MSSPGFIINAAHFVKRSSTSYALSPLKSLFRVGGDGCRHAPVSTAKSKVFTSIGAERKRLVSPLLPPKVLLLFERWNLTKAPQMVKMVIKAPDCVSLHIQSSKFAAGAVYYFFVAKASLSLIDVFTMRFHEQGSADGTVSKPPALFLNTPVGID